MKKIIILCLLTLLITACKNNADEKTRDQLITLRPLASKVLVKDFSAYIDTVEIVPLETLEESFIDHIREILVTKTKDICLQTSKTVLLFDSFGRFRFIIGKTGRGPGEYTRVTDMCISGNEENLLILDCFNDILRYSLSDGHFIERIKPEWKGKKSSYNGICPSSDNGFFLFAPNPPAIEKFDSVFYCLGKFDQNGKLLEESLVRKDFNVPVNHFTRSYDYSTFMRPPGGENSFYRISNGKVSPYLRINFEEQAIPLKYIFSFPGNPWLHLNKFIKSPYYKLPMDLLETETHLYFWSGGPGGTTHEFLYTKVNKNGIHWTSGDKIPFNFMAADSGWFYSVYNIAEESNFTNNYEKNPLKIYFERNYGLGKFDTDSNPVLVKFRFVNFK